MSEQRRLALTSNHRAIGWLIEQDGIWALEYDAAWQLAPDAFALSPALPLATALHRDDSTRRSVQWYFDNLLPEENLRAVLSEEQGVGASDAFGLLQCLGAESAGSLVLLPPGSPPAEQGAQTLDLRELSARIRQLPHASLTARSPKRMSLAGAQHKMVVVFDPRTGTLQEPLRASASTHILKPDGLSAEYPHSVVNETFTMRLALRMGLDVPPVYRLHVPEAVYIVERFDRQKDAATHETTRLHVVDACQLLDQPRDFKYSNARLDTLVRLIDLCRTKAAARRAIFRWVLFNTLVGNSDSHLKNLSFLVSAEGVRIAPFYDLLCTAVYHARVYADDAAIWPREPLAIPIVDAGTFADVTREKLIRTGQTLGLARPAAERETATMIGRLAAEADQLIGDMQHEFSVVLEEPTAQAHRDALRATRGAEARLLQAVRSIVIGDMLRLVG